MPRKSSRKSPGYAVRGERVLPGDRTPPSSAYLPPLQAREFAPPIPGSENEKTRKMIDAIIAARTGGHVHGLECFDSGGQRVCGR